MMDNNRETIRKIVWLICGPSTLTGLLIWGGAWGRNKFASSDFSRLGTEVFYLWEHCAGYTKEELIGVALLTYLWPIAWLLGVWTSLAVYKMRDGGLICALFKTSYFTTVIALGIVAAVWGYKHTAWDPLRCGIIGCFALKNHHDDDATIQYRSPFSVVVGLSVLICIVPSLLFELRLLLGSLSLLIRALKQRPFSRNSSVFAPTSIDHRLTSCEMPSMSMPSNGSASAVVDNPLQGASTAFDGENEDEAKAPTNDTNKSVSTPQNKRTATKLRLAPLDPRPSKVRTVALALALVSSLCILLLLTAWLPNTWMYFHRKGLHNYFHKDRVETGRPEGYLDRKFVMRTVTKTYAHGRLILKFYPDCFIYYSFLATLVILGCLARCSEPVAKIFRRRIRLPTWRYRWRVPCGGAGCYVEMPSAALSSSRGGIGTKLRRASDRAGAMAAPKLVDVSTGPALSLGTIVALTLFLTMFILFSRYWFRDHWFHGSGRSDRSHAEIVARGSGQIVNLLLALNLLPVSRHSAIGEAFGISWEQMLWFHIATGYGILLSLLVHMFEWWKVYDEYNIFPMDVFQVPMRYPGILYLPKSFGRCGDNWTIPLANITTLLVFVCMGGLAHHRVRRRAFELFYYAHHVAAYAMYGTALWHSASAWYYLLGSFLVYAYDLASRLSCASRNWHVVDLEPMPGDITRITLAPQQEWGDEPKSLFKYSAGQYVFLKFDDVDFVQFHPFTIASSPTDARSSEKIRGGLVCDVKAMASPSADKYYVPTYTQTLNGIANDLSTASPGKRRLILDALSVSVDGPHGPHFTPLEFDSLLFVCGGIGVTPCHSIFREMYLQAKHGSLGRSGPKIIELLWVVRDPKLFELYANTLAEVIADDLDGRFRLRLFVTKTKDSSAQYVLSNSNNSISEYLEAASRVLEFSYGRPDAVDIITDIAQRYCVPHVFACGPAPLVSAFDMACLNFPHVDFHSEVFDF